MSILSFLLGEKKKSASVAKERLQLIIAHERVGGRPITCRRCRKSWSRSSRSTSIFRTMTSA